MTFSSEMPDLLEVVEHLRRLGDVFLEAGARAAVIAEGGQRRRAERC